MPGSVVSRHKRIMAGILGILMPFIMLFSVLYIAAEADHDCAGEDCPICVSVQQCERTLHQMGDGAASQAAVMIPVVFVLISTSLYAAGFRQETLVSKKVRLDN